MGNRANFVVVKDQDWQLYYSHWAGCRMLDALIAGQSSRFAMQSLRPCGKNEWVSPSGPTVVEWSTSIVAGCCSSVTE